MGNPDEPTPPHIVDKLIEAAKNPRNHRYSASRGITKLRHAITAWYQRHYDVELDPESEAIVTIGSKEGLAHLALAMVSPGDVVLTPTPTYPIHPYSVIIAGGEVRGIPLRQNSDFFEDLTEAYRRTLPRPKMLIINFPHNPTTAVVAVTFFKKIVAFAKENSVYVIHDLAYADLVFDGYKAPSFLQAPGAKDVGVEFFTLSKSYNMPGWRVGFCVGNPKMVGALQTIKSYLDYGIFQPIQIAAIIALNGPQDCVQQTIKLYRDRRDALVDGLNRIGWKVEKPLATMFVWAPIPDAYRSMGSLEFSKLLLHEAKVAVSPGIGFGECGDDHVRFGLVENEHRTRQAIRGIKKALKLSGGEE
jgi:alanine-synthesizing transaminase